MIIGVMKVNGIVRRERRGEKRYKNGILGNILCREN